MKTKWLSALGYSGLNLRLKLYLITGSSTLIVLAVMLTANSQLFMATQDYRQIIERDVVLQHDVLLFHDELNEQIIVAQKLVYVGEQHEREKLLFAMQDKIGESHRQGARITAKNARATGNHVPPFSY